MIPEGLSNHISSELIKNGLTKIAINGFKIVVGGCINSTGVIECGQRSFFIKWNSRVRYPDMFRLEFLGLQELRNNCSLRIPEPLIYGEDEFHCFLVMEHIKSAPKKDNFWSALGFGLAELHCKHSNGYGWAEDNFIGSLVQKNPQTTNWVDFFIENRLRETLKLAVQKGNLSTSDLEFLDRIEYSIRTILDEEEKPSLIHGDLWGGNILSDQHGNPCIIDPALYYANREIEIAFTTLFGRFDKKFYESYQLNLPLAENFKDKIEIYNLYPILVHAILFGGGYVESARRIMKKFS